MGEISIGGETELTHQPKSPESMEDIIASKRELIADADRVLALFKERFESTESSPTLEEGRAIRESANYYARIRKEAEKYLEMAKANNPEQFNKAVEKIDNPNESGSSLN